MQYSFNIPVRIIWPSTQLLFVPRHNLSFGSRAFRVSAPKVWNALTSSHQAITITLHFQTSSKDTLLPVSLSCHLASIHQRALILFIQTLALYKSFYLLTYLLTLTFDLETWLQLYKQLGRCYVHPFISYSIFCAWASLGLITLTFWPQNSFAGYLCDTEEYKICTSILSIIDLNVAAHIDAHEYVDLVTVTCDLLCNIYRLRASIDPVFAPRVIAYSFGSYSSFPFWAGYDLVNFTVDILT